jgi:hypothetical protein
MRCSRKGLETGPSTVETVFEKLIFIDLAQVLGTERLLIIEAMAEVERDALPL